MKLSIKPKKLLLKLPIFIFTLFFLLFQTASPIMATTVSDSYTDSSKIDTGNSSNYQVSGGQLKLGSPPPNAAWWKMDETSGSTVADSSGNGNNGTATGTTIVSGKYGNARSFNGTSDIVIIGANKLGPILNGASAVTVEAWINPSALPSSARARVLNIPIATNSLSGFVVALFNDAGTVKLEMGGRSVSSDSYQAGRYNWTLGTGSWHHVAGVFDYASDTIKVYIDGSQAINQAVTFANTTYTNGAPGTGSEDVLGAYRFLSNNGNYWNGSSDDVRIYNYARSQTEIQADMDMNNTAYLTSATIQSTNLLSGEGGPVSAINEFVYNLSSKPAGTTTTIQFSQDATSWYNSSGTLGGTDTLNTGANNTIAINSLGWSGANFYYKIAFGGDGTTTPTLDDITLDYTITGTCSFPTSGNYTISISCAFSSTSATTALDVSTSGNEGTVTGATIVSGKYGAARSFDSTNNIVISDDNSLDFGTGIFTISAWIKTTTTADNRNLIRKGAGAGLSGWRFGLSNGKPHVLIGDASTYTEGLVGSASIADGQWHHMAVVFNRGSNAVGYIDGEQAGTLNISAQSGSVDNSSSVTMGNTYATFVGSVDDVRIYNYARSESQITEDMNEAITLTGSAPVGHWRMDDGYIDGVDNGNLTIQQYKTLTINAGQTVVWNPEKSITIEDGGSIAMNTSGRLRQAYLYVTDADGDGYPASSNGILRYAQTAPANASRRYLASSGTDCNDVGINAAQVYISQTCYVDGDGDSYTSSSSVNCTNNATCSSATWGSVGTGAASSYTAGRLKVTLSSPTDCNDANASVWINRTVCDSCCEQRLTDNPCGCSNNTYSCVGYCWYVNCPAGPPNCEYCPVNYNCNCRTECTT